MAGRIRTCDMGVLKSGVLMILFVVTLLAGLREAASCYLLNALDDRAGFIRKGSGSDYTGYTRLQCSSMCNDNCACLGYAYFAGNKLKCFLYTNFNAGNIFNDSYTFHVRLAPQPRSSSPPPPSPSPTGSNNLFAIIGGVLGGVVALLLSGGITFYCCWQVQPSDEK